ncbi:MAG: UvrD-helicase domain-containing protein [Bacteroidota bacterium]
MMRKHDLKKTQERERSRCLRAILNSRAKRKIIVAGPGTGKTFTFKKVLELRKGGENIAMTFIRKLAEDMDKSLGQVAEVKTFHAYCKKILHQQNGRVELVPYLSEVIAQDSNILGKGFSAFDMQFQCLQVATDDIRFYLERGDYYEVVSFNDSVYRLYKALKENADILPQFHQILIDEFQDFNILEVAFIDELQKRGPIILVGDDDQAIYDDRYASPNYLRTKFRSGEYETFQLPFCSRCPDPIVRATNAIIRAAKRKGALKDRISKPFECYLADKEVENRQYPKIVIGRCTNALAVAKYVRKVISGVSAAEVGESWIEGNEYPTVLIVGPKQYLAKIEKDLKKVYPQLKYAKSGDVGYRLADGYEQLLKVRDSNLGWRIVAEFSVDQEPFETMITKSIDGTPFKSLLDKGLLLRQLEVLKILKACRNDGVVSEVNRRKLDRILAGNADEVIDRLFPTVQEKLEVDRTAPSILLTSFKGCKGLSAGHVVIVGANNGSIPMNPDRVRDVEIGQFIVALTRTRKQCHVVSNKWLYAPKDNHGNWIAPFEKSSFLEFIPPALIEDLGELNATKIDALQ